MAVTGVMLTDPQRGITSVIKPRAGVAFQGFEFAATVREETEDFAQADGALDTTGYLSTGAVTVTVAVPDGNRALLDELAAFLVPWARPYLQVTDSGWPSPRQIQLRFDSAQHPITTGTGLRRDVQYSWKAPRGLWEDTAVQQFIVAADVADTTGMVFDDTSGTVVTAADGYVFQPSTHSASSIIRVTGTARPAWRARLYGPATGPVLTNDSLGLSVAFLNTLVLGAGDYVELNSGPGRLAKTANLLSDPDASRLSFIDFGATTWFPLDPGPNLVRYHADSGTSPATACELTIFPVWMP